MHHTTATNLYKKRWRFGYYSGWDSQDITILAKENKLVGKDSPNWIWVDDSNFKWKLDFNLIPTPILTNELIKKLAKGFIWAVVLFEEK